MKAAKTAKRKTVLSTKEVLTKCLMVICTQVSLTVKLVKSYSTMGRCLTRLYKRLNKHVTKRIT